PQDYHQPDHKYSDGKQDVGWKINYALASKSIQRVNRPDCLVVLLEKKLSPESRFSAKDKASSVVSYCKGALECARFLSTRKLGIVFLEQKAAAHYSFTVYAVGLIQHNEFAGFSKHCESDLGHFFLAL